MSRDGRKYAVYWDILKSEGVLKVRCFIPAVRTVKRMIFKEKDEDINFKFFMAEQNLKCRLVTTVTALPDEEGKKKVEIIFNLQKRLIISSETL